MASFSPPQQPLSLLGCQNCCSQSIVHCRVHPGGPPATLRVLGCGVQVLPVPSSPSLASALSCWILETGLARAVVSFHPACSGELTAFRRDLYHLYPRSLHWVIPSVVFSASCLPQHISLIFPKINFLLMDNSFFPLTAQAAWLSLLLLPSQSQPLLYLLSCSMSSVTALRSESRTSCTSTTS